MLIAATASAAIATGEPSFKHGVSDFGQFKYPEGFAHFDYVNPDSPKGGTLRLATATSFNSFTPIIPKGLRPPGLHVIELTMLYDSLFWPSDDEPGSFYGNLVEHVAVAPDYTWAIFRIRPEARWHDGVLARWRAGTWRWRLRFQRAGALAPVARADLTHQKVL